MSEAYCSIEPCGKKSVAKYKGEWYCLEDLIDVMKNDGRTKEEITKKLKIIEIHLKFRLAELKELNKL